MFNKQSGKNKKKKWLLIIFYIFIGVVFINVITPLVIPWQVYTSKPSSDESFLTKIPFLGNSINDVSSQRELGLSEKTVDGLTSYDVFFQFEIPFGWTKDGPSSNRCYEEMCNTVDNAIYSTGIRYDFGEIQVPVDPYGTEPDYRLQLYIIDAFAIDTNNEIYGLEDSSDNTFADNFANIMKQLEKGKYERKENSNTDSILYEPASLGGYSGYKVSNELFIRHGNFIVILCQPARFYDSEEEAKEIWDHAVSSFKFLE